MSTNSITQGEQVSIFWHELKISLLFAYRSFVWNSDTKDKAQVHCVILGFCYKGNNYENKIIFLENGNIIAASHINGYLIDYKDVFIKSRKSPLIENAPIMRKGSQPTDGGFLIIKTEQERKNILKIYPFLEPYIKRYMGADDLISNKYRYCFWLKNCPVDLINKSKYLLDRLNGVRESRLHSRKESTQKWAKFPYLFTEDRQPLDDYLIVPVVSGENRDYVPMAYVSKDVIANTNAQTISNCSLYAFGILTSRVHMLWLKTVCGRMKSDFAYSATIVYNNFIWPECKEGYCKLIEQSARNILEVRKTFSEKNLESLYNKLTMPKALYQAHEINDKNVLRAYGLNVNASDLEIIQYLFKLYENTIKNKE